MTLETAKRLVLEQGEYANKEAQAVARGGMTICELTPDGHRVYPWIKVKPTKTNEESSIELALKNHQEKKLLRATRTTANTLPASVEAKPSPPIQTTIDFSKEAEKQLLPASFLERIKKKNIDIWKEIDSIVEE